MIKTISLAVLLLGNPLLLVGHLRWFRKNYFSSVTHTTHKETSAVSDPGMLGQV